MIECDKCGEPASMEKEGDYLCWECFLDMQDGWQPIEEGEGAEEV